MDDTQDKVRRNLVVFSAAIVIGWFLNLKITDIAKPFVSTNIADVNVGRLWLAILAVLAYLFLRYRFDNSTDFQIKSLFDEQERQKRNYLFKYLQRKINQINRTEKFTTIFHETLSRTVAGHKQQYEMTHSEKVSFRLQISNPLGDADPTLDEEKSIWEGTVGISEEYWRAGTAGKNTYSGDRYEFSIPFFGRIWIKIHSIVHLVSYSKSAVDFIVPMSLAGVAFLVAAGKLIKIYSS